MKAKIHDYKQLYVFFCEGCKSVHQVNNSWNVDIVNITITPSVLVTAPNDIRRCHSFITEGKIKYLSDSTHKYKNETLDLLEFEFDHKDGSFMDPTYRDSHEG